MAVKTTHVGSLPRSQEVVDFIFAREQGKDYDPAAFDAAMNSAVAATVARQKDAGVSIVSDGETSKISYATYVKDRYTGFDGDSPRNAPADLKLFPSFLQRLADDGGTPTYARPMCVGEVRSKGQDELNKDIANLRAAMDASGVEHGFMNAASPGVISLFLQNDFYPTREAYLAALADAMREEYQTIVAAGLDLQLDCPDLALSRHMLFTDLSDEEFLNVAALHVEALNHALEGVPKDRVRVHICWGNYEGPHVCDIPMAKMFDTLMSTHAGKVLFQTPTPGTGTNGRSLPSDGRTSRGQDSRSRRDRFHHQLCRASRTGGRAHPALCRHGRRGPGDCGLGLRLRHLCRVWRRRS